MNRYYWQPSDFSNYRDSDTVVKMKDIPIKSSCSIVRVLIKVFSEEIKSVVKEKYEFEKLDESKVALFGIFELSSFCRDPMKNGNRILRYRCKALD